MSAIFQTLAQQRTLKTLGSKYVGPRLDRPCLRQLPRGWVISEATPVKKPISPEVWVGTAALLGWLFAFIQTCLEWM